MINLKRQPPRTLPFDPSPLGTIFHLPTWKIIWRKRGHHRRRWKLKQAAQDLAESHQAIWFDNDPLSKQFIDRSPDFKPPTGASLFSGWIK